MIAQTLMANFALPALPPPATLRAGLNVSSAPFVSEPRATSLACSPCAGRGGADNPAAARIAFLLPGRSAPHNSDTCADLLTVGFAACRQSALDDRPSGAGRGVITVNRGTAGDAHQTRTGGAGVPHPARLTSRTHRHRGGFMGGF